MIPRDARTDLEMAACCTLAITSHKVTAAFAKHLRRPAKPILTSHTSSAYIL